MNAAVEKDAADVLDFWFADETKSRWFGKEPEFDALIRDRFGAVHSSAACCELFAWRKTSLGRLAEIIVLDQFSRNMFRDEAAAFACDPLALALAQEAISVGADQDIEQSRRNFIYMPFMHSESLAIHDVAMDLFAGSGNESSLEFERRHRAIIERFGRYPHRNALLGRPSTAQEKEFLDNPGSSF